jgi:hypothetical protein
MFERKRNKIYLAGPMSGYPEWNFPAFMAAEDYVRLLRVGVVNPARAFGGKTDIDWHICLSLCVRRLVRECDQIWMLPGWTKSRGAVIEHLVARGLGLEVNYLDDAEKSTEEIEGMFKEANNIVFGARENDYGHPIHDFTRQLNMARVAGIKMHDVIDVPLFMMMVKISRHVNRPKRDNLVDLCGYAMTIRRVREKTDLIPRNLTTLYHFILGQLIARYKARYIEITLEEAHAIQRT